MANEKKANHYLPKWEQLYFTNDENLLWVYHKTRKIIKHQAPVITGVINDFYTFEDIRGEKNRQLEDIFCVFEGDAAKVIEKFQGKRFVIDEYDKIKLSHYIAFKGLRTPSHYKNTEMFLKSLLRNEILAKPIAENNPQTFINAYEELTGQRINIQTIKDKISKKELNVDFEIQKKTILPLMFEGVRNIARKIYDSYWHIQYLPTKNHAFITSDNSFFAIPDGKGIEKLPLQASLFFPNNGFLVAFTPNLCIMFEENKSEVNFYIPDGRRVREINKLIAENSYDYIISHNEQLLSSVLKYANRK